MEYPSIDIKATGNRIKELRKAEHKSVRELADFMGFEATQAVYKWEQGKSLPTIDNYYALCKFFNKDKVSDIIVAKETERSVTSRNDEER